MQLDSARVDSWLREWLSPIQISSSHSPSWPVVTTTASPTVQATTTTKHIETWLNDIHRHKSFTARYGVRTTDLTVYKLYNIDRHRVKFFTCYLLDEISKSTCYLLVAIFEIYLLLAGIRKLFSYFLLATCYLLVAFFEIYLLLATCWNSQVIFKFFTCCLLLATCSASCSASCYLLEKNSW